MANRTDAWGNAMSTLMHFGDSEKVRAKLDACRKAGLKVLENSMTGVTAVYNDDDCQIQVLKCVRKGENRWEMTFNMEFWDELVVQDAHPQASPTI